MKRSEALTSLSHEHHQALRMSQLLRRALPATARELRNAFETFWVLHGHVHFRLEEEVLFPAYARHANPHHKLMLEALGDHIEIRERAESILASDEPPIGELRELGEVLATHVRLEERELFPLIEQAIPRDRHAALAAQIAEAEIAITPPVPRQAQA